MLDLFPQVVGASLDKAEDRIFLFKAANALDKHQTLYPSAEAVKAMAQAPPIEIKESTRPDSGFGVFATRSLNEGDVITEYVGNKTLYAGRAAPSSVEEDEMVWNYFGPGAAHFEARDAGVKKQIAFQCYDNAFFSASCKGSRQMASIFGDNYSETMSLAQAASIMNDHSCIQLTDLDNGQLQEATLAYVHNISLTNAVMVPLGDQLYAVANRSIEEGEEIFHCYTSRYWLGHVLKDFIHQCAHQKFMQPVGSKIDPEHVTRKQHERIALISRVSESVVGLEKQYAGRHGVMERSGVQPLQPMPPGAAKAAVRAAVLSEILDLEELSPHTRHKTLEALHEVEIDLEVE
jgi:hypothetical protein